MYAIANLDKTWCVQENVRLFALVDEFAEHMKAKLAVKVCQGFAGWDDPAWRDEIVKNLVAHADGVDKADDGQFVDIANLAMFAWGQCMQAGGQA